VFYTPDEKSFVVSDRSEGAGMTVAIAMTVARHSELTTEKMLSV
jgi:hypothetical protein